MTSGAPSERIVCTPDELRTLFLFEKLSDEQLAWLSRDGRVEHFEPGLVYAEGEPATRLYVLFEGEVVILRRVGEDEVETARSSQRGVYGGAFLSFLGNTLPQLYVNSMRATQPSWFFVLDSHVFEQMMREWFPMTLHLLQGLFFGMRNTQEAVGQRERLLALGALSAGLTHELNNPAAAAVRATSALRDRVYGMRQKLGTIASGAYEPATLAALVKLQHEAVEHVCNPPVLTPIEAADREDAIADWLADHAVDEAWTIAPSFVQAGLDREWLEQVVAAVGGCGQGTLEGALRWLNYTVETELLLNEIQDSTTRISTLVASAKQYSQMDRAPYQTVDVHELLDSTLLMLAHKIGDGITVVKDYDRSLPSISAYAAELNQVWTNLVDNAVAAMQGSGTLTVRTARDQGQVLVEIGDTGAGVPPAIRDRIFEPFFTTKDVGEGTGLGLDISWRIVVNKHHGDLRVESRPGDTRFQVRLPLHSPEPHFYEPAS
jgi:signal transduction histidine kinase